MMASRHLPDLRGPRRAMTAVRLMGAWQRSPLTRRILGAALTVATAALLLKVATAGRELAVAYYFGTSDVIDAFLVAFLAPSFIVNAPIAAFSAALMPTFIRVRDEEGKAAAARLASNGMVAALAMLVAGSAVLALLARPIVGLLGSGFAPAKIELTVQLFHLLLPVVVLQGLARYWGTLINASQRFGLVALAQLATPLLTVAFLVAMGGRGGVHLLVAGVVGGAMLELALILAAARNLRLPRLPRWHGLDDPTRIVLRQYLPVVFGTLMGGATIMVDQAMAASLEPGSVAALTYGGKLVSLMLAFSAAPLGTALLPYLSQLAADGNLREIRRSYLGWLGIIVLSSVPLAIGFALFSEPIVRLVFERGAFTPADTAAVAPIQAWYALQLPFYLVGTLGARVLSALRFNQALGFIGGSNFVLNIALNLLLIRWLGLQGIALATVIVYVASSIMITALIWWRLRGARAPARRPVGPA
jgi:putative peptidoglycan lipid II flippase